MKDKLILHSIFSGEHKTEYLGLGTHESSDMEVIMRQRIVGEEGESKVQRVLRII